MRMTWINVGVVVALFTLGSVASAATYYVDSITGDDSSNGLSITSAWKSIDRVNRQAFEPGDHILFKAGTRYTGQLKPQGSGSYEPQSSKIKPIVIDKYADGEKPRIDAEGKYQSALLLENVGCWEVNNLELTNTGKTVEPLRYGAQIRIQNFGTARHIYLKNLYVHDVNGSCVKEDGGGVAIVWENRGRDKVSVFNDLRIEGCHIQHCERNGIVGSSGYTARNNWHPSIGVIVRNNLIEEIPGDAIVPIGCDGALVEYNVCRNFTRLLPDGDAAAGIWPWSSDNTIVQYNEVSGHKAPWDAQGFDSDWNCRNTIIQYNYSHDNEGGFLLICNDGGSKMPKNTGNTGTIVRYNVSVNDGLRAIGKNVGFSPTFHITGPLKDTKIYNNTIYVPAKPDAKIDRTMIEMGDWGGGFPDNTQFINNIFYVDGETCYKWGKSTKTTFESNLFFGKHINAPKDEFAVRASPLFVNPKAAKDGMSSLSSLQLSAGSPCIHTGKIVDRPVLKDFAGCLIPPDARPCIGAFEFDAKRK